MSERRREISREGERESRGRRQQEEGREENEKRERIGISSSNHKMLRTQAAAAAVARIRLHFALLCSRVCLRASCPGSCCDISSSGLSLSLPLFLISSSTLFPGFFLVQRCLPGKGTYLLSLSRRSLRCSRPGAHSGAATPPPPSLVADPQTYSFSLSSPSSLFFSPFSLSLI